MWQRVRNYFGLTGSGEPIDPKTVRRRRIYGLVDILGAALIVGIAWLSGLRGNGAFWIAIPALLGMQLLTRWLYSRRYGADNR